MRNKILKCDNINGINFSVLEPSINVFIGKNNDEIIKLFKNMVGIDECYGRVLLNNIDISNTEKIGLYMQNLNLSEGTVFDNIMEPLKNIGNSDSVARKKVYAITKKIDINNVLYKNIDELSFSQKKLVSFAKTVVIEPDVLLLYDIFSSLDKYYRNKVVECIKELKIKDDTIIIFASNDPEDYLLADRMIIMLEDRVVINDSLKTAFENQEKLFNSNKIKIPFIVDLSYKLMSYELINHVIYDIEDMVDELWK